MVCVLALASFCYEEHYLLFADPAMKISIVLYSHAEQKNFVKKFNVYCANIVVTRFQRLSAKDYPTLLWRLPPDRSA